MDATLRAEWLEASKRNQCLGCGYSLRGLTEDGACPECGLEVIASNLGAARVGNTKRVIVRAGAYLPPRCIRCGAPAAELKRRSIFRLSRLLYLTLLYPPLFILAALLTGRRSQVYVGLCRRDSRRRGAGALLIIAAIFAFAIGIGLLLSEPPNRRRNEEQWAAYVFVAAGMLGALYGLKLLGGTSVRATKINPDGSMVLNGPHEAFLSQLPVSKR